MAKSFTIKTIQISITLGKGNFSEGGNTKIIEGLACDVTVEKPGLPEKNSARVQVWGLKRQDMDQLTMLTFRPLESHHNIIEVMAGDRGEKLSLVFKGEITSANADLNAEPDPYMEFEADTGSYPQQIALPVTTVKGQVEAAQLFGQFTQAAGYNYLNQGVTASVANAWFPGSPIDKIRKLARDIGCELLIDDGTVITMDAGQARSGNAVLLTPETGMIGYPSFNQDGISCRCQYNPDLSHGGLIKVESDMPRATGVWRITKLTHNLSAYSPDGGPWESQVEAAYYGQ